MPSSNDSPADTTTQATLSDLSRIEITYRTSDRFGDDRLGDPNIAYVQHVYAEIEGWNLEEDFRVALGHLSLARIDLWEVGDQFLDVLDAESTEWTSYFNVLESTDDDPRFLLIFDRAEIVPWARGHDIGLHAVARAIRTWGEDALVVLTAFPPGGTGQERRAGGEALSRHWSRLGLKRVEGSVPPLLTGTTESDQLADAIAELSDWRPPAPAR